MNNLSELNDTLYDMLREIKNSDINDMKFDKTIDFYRFLATE